MIRFCVAVSNPFSGNLTQSTLFATSAFDAVCRVLGLDPDDYDDLDDIENMLGHSGDTMVSVIEI